MIYNYSPLFETLKQKGLSRKQLREALQLSPATMARMSAGEPIATETLGRICDLLQCSLDKIFTIKPEKELPGRWASIDNALPDGKPQTFRVYMYFLLPTERNEPALYLYGYAKPFIVEETGMEKWQVTCETETSAQFCIIKGTLYANDLRRFLDAATNSQTMENIFRFLDIIIMPDSNKNKKNFEKEYLPALLKARIANGRFVYRPPYLLLPQNATLLHTAELMPLLSYEEETTICESLHGTNKRSYYCTKTGIDTAKAQLIWVFLSKMLPFHYNLNEMARLGNFEVLTYPNGTLYQPVRCEIWRDNNVQKGAKITISNQLSGKYILRVKLQNGRNPILDNSYVINPQDEEENPVFIALNEDFFFAEVELWTALTTDNTEQRLIYQSCTPYVRQLSVTMSVLERNLILEDRWSQAMKKQGKKVNTNVAFFITEPDSPTVGLPEEPWLTEEKNIQHDYHILFGEGKKLHEHDAFFPKGTDKTIAFLAWLKERLKSLPKTKRVLLFDPFINDEAIVNFVRKISNIRITYEIITDSKSGRKAEEREKEINAIKELSVTLGNVIRPCNLTVHTLIGKAAGSLHDRVLMIVDAEQVIVYVLSNSLDAVAKKHSTIVTAVKPAVAQEIFNDYLKLIGNAKDKNDIDMIFNTKKATLSVIKPTGTTPETTKNNKESSYNGKSSNTTDPLPSIFADSSKAAYTKDDFVRDYSGQSIETALEKLAYMSYDEYRVCVNYVMSLNKTKEIGRLQALLLKAKNIPAKNLNQDLGIYIHSLNQMMLQQFDLAGKLVECAANAITYCFHYRPAIAFAFNYAIRILWAISPEKYTVFLENLIEELYKNNQDATKTTFTPETLLIYSIIAHIVNSISYETERDMQFLAKSKTPYLRAIYAAKCTRLSEEFLNALIQGKEEKTDYLTTKISNQCEHICSSFEPTEACTALIFLIKKLQIEICRNKSVQQSAQSLIKIIITFYVQTLAKNKKSDTSSLIQQLAPLDMRNPADICQIASMLTETKFITNEQSYEVLIHFWKLSFTTANGKDKEFYNEETIQRSVIITNHILKNGKDTAEKLQKVIEKHSRILCNKLYDPLLYEKNYTAWKIAVEQLACLFITERNIVKNNKNLTMGKGETEYKKLMENYDEKLSQYSVVYKLWKQTMSCFQ